MKRNRITIIGWTLVALLSVGFIFILVRGFRTNDQNQTPPGADQAQKTLSDYLNNLHTGQYQSAAALYGGPVEVLQGYNPDLHPTDEAGLLERACTINGFQCLQPVQITQDETTSDGDYIFSVSFQNENGELFVLGPCCGADETDSPPVSKFSFTIQLDPQGQYQVMDLPPYQP